MVEKTVLMPHTRLKPDAKKRSRRTEKKSGGAQERTLQESYYGGQVAQKRDSGKIGGGKD